MQNLENYLNKFKIYLKHLKILRDKLKPDLTKITTENENMIKILPKEVGNRTGIELLLALLMKALADGNSDFVDELHKGLTNGKDLKLITDYEDKEKKLLGNIDCGKENDKQICDDVKMTEPAKKNCCQIQIAEVKPKIQSSKQSEEKENKFGKITTKVAQAMGIAAGR